MQFRVLFGAHPAAKDHLAHQLNANRALLEANGILLPDDEVMEAAVWPALRAARKGRADESTVRAMSEQLTEGKPYKAVLILRPAISGSPLQPIKEDAIYPRGSAMVAHFVRLVGQENVRLFCAVRNPADFLLACYNDAFLYDPSLMFQDFVKMGDPIALRWSEYLHRVQGRDTELPLTVWSFEDYPYIWRGVAQAVSGLPNKEDLAASDAPFDQSISLKGLALMQQFLKKHPEAETTRRLLIAQKFAERFPMSTGDAIPKLWPKDLVEAMGESYDDDLYYIERMENVHMLTRPKWS